MNELTRDNPETRTVRWFWPALFALAILHFTIAMLAVRTKSVTYDEPLHTIGGWSVNQFNDFRLEPENPILFERYAGLLSTPDELKLDQNSEVWRSFIYDAENTFRTMYRQVYVPPVDIDSMVNRRRPTFALLGALTVIGVGCLTRSISRSMIDQAKSVAPEMGALCAGALIAFNPTMLGHSPLVKNDVILALAMTWVASGVWWVMRRASWWSVLWLSLGIAVAPLVKFSGIFAGPIVAIVLLIRGLSPEPWIVIQRSLQSRKLRIGAAIWITLCAAIISYGVLWLSYGMRYSATTDGTPLNFQWLVNVSRESAFIKRFGLLPPKESIPNLPIESQAQLMLDVNQLHVVPEAFSYGLLHVDTLARFRTYYFFGKITDDPPLAYFPVAFALKEPLANLALLIVVVPLAVWRLRSIGRQSSVKLLCVLLPGVIFLIIAMSGPITIGLRHLLPIYPTIFMAIGLACAVLWRTSMRYAILALVSLSVIESLARAPDFISFFNLAAGGRTNQSRIFCDSNIDWGQDLKQLIRWRKKNPDGPLFIQYFGTVDPDWYGIENTILFKQMTDDDVAKTMPQEAGVAAISVYDLRGMNRLIDPRQLAPFQKHEPFEILGGSIYLYHWPLEAQEDSR